MIRMASCQWDGCLFDENKAHIIINIVSFGFCWLLVTRFLAQAPPPRQGGQQSAELGQFVYRRHSSCGWADLYTDGYPRAVGPICIPTAILVRLEPIYMNRRLSCRRLFEHFPLLPRLPGGYFWYRVSFTVVANLYNPMAFTSAVVESFSFAVPVARR